MDDVNQPSGVGLNGDSGPTDVLIFVPGAGGVDSIQPPHLAEMLCWEMDLRARNQFARFAARPASVDGDAVYRIERTDPDSTFPVLDVYFVKHEMMASAGTVTSAPAIGIGRVFGLAAQVLAGILIFAGALFRPRRHTKSFAQMLQLLLCLLILFVLATYFLTTIYAFLQPVGAVAAGAGASVSIHWPQWIVLGAAVAGALLPKYRAMLTDTAELYRRLMRYFWGNKTRNNVIGQLQDVVDRVNQRPEVRNIHLVGHSFGGLVILDTLFPVGRVDLPQMPHIDYIVTLGLPLQLLSMLQPSYPRNRTEAAATERHWLNIYDPRDPLGTDPSDANGVGDASCGLVLQNGRIRMPDDNVPWNAEMKLTAIGLLTLEGLRSHGGYWGRNARSRSAFGIVISRIFNDRPALR